jgi:hypothetical protein
VGCLGLAAFLALGSLQYAQAEPHEQPAFPVPRAEREFSRLRSIVEGAAASGPMEVREYLALAGPFAPLDLQVASGGASDASLLKNLYLGLCGAALQIDTARLARDFHCGPDCTARRSAYASDHLEQLTELARALRKTKNVGLIAQWGRPGSFRVNELFKIGSSVREAIPSPEFGLLPSGAWNEFATAELYFSTRGIDGSATLALVHMAEELGVGAVARLVDGTVAVFIVGLGDNQSGVLFQEPSQSAPQLGGQLQNGLEYVVVRKLKPGVYYFETT